MWLYCRVRHTRAPLPLIHACRAQHTGLVVSCWILTQVPLAAVTRLPADVLSAVLPCPVLCASSVGLRPAHRELQPELRVGMTLCSVPALLIRMLSDSAADMQCACARCMLSLRCVTCLFDSCRFVRFWCKILRSRVAEVHCTSTGS